MEDISDILTFDVRSSVGDEKIEDRLWGNKTFSSVIFDSSRINNTSRNSRTDLPKFKKLDLEQLPQPIQMRSSSTMAKHDPFATNLNFCPDMTGRTSTDFSQSVFFGTGRPTPLIRYLPKHR
jgi:hypothetical protein